jgi:predicted nucleic acid-binding protein
MKPKVYIETSIPSFYYETRTGAAAVARREWTYEWWEMRRHFYEVVTSDAVQAELEYTPEPKRQQCMDFLATLPLLAVNAPVTKIVSVYIQNKVMPSDSTGDALHLAIASYYQCDYLLTWNCKHLANGNKFSHIRHINTTLGLYIPTLVTPLELLGEKA